MLFTSYELFKKKTKKKKKKKKENLVGGPMEGKICQKVKNPIINQITIDKTAPFYFIPDLTNG